MSKTRIYFLSETNRHSAELFANWMPGRQDIIDYYLQLNGLGLKFPDKPNGYSSRMIGIDKKRDIVIFIGDDYQRILDAIDED